MGETERTYVTMAGKTIGKCASGIGCRCEVPAICAVPAPTDKCRFMPHPDKKDNADEH